MAGSPPLDHQPQVTPVQAPLVSKPDSPRQLTATLIDAGLRPGDHTLLIRAANPLRQGVPPRFANAAQDTTVDGWLTLGRTLIS